MYVVDIATLAPMTFEQAQAQENAEETGLTLGFSVEGLNGTRYALLTVGDMPLVDQRYYSVQLGPVIEDAGQYFAEWEIMIADLPIEQMAQNKLDDLGAACETDIMSGFYSSALGSTHRYSSDRDSQTNIQWNMFPAMNGEPVSHICYDADNVRAEREHTAEQFIQVGRDFGNHLWPKLRMYGEKRQAVADALAAGDKGALALISWD